MLLFGHQVNPSISAHKSQITWQRRLEKAHLIVDSSSLHQAPLSHIGNYKFGNCSVVGRHSFCSSFWHEEPHQCNHDPGWGSHPSNIIEAETQHQEQHQSRISSSGQHPVSFTSDWIFFRSPRLSIILHQDNTSAILLERNGRSSTGKLSWHINIWCCFIKDRIQNWDLET